MSKHHLIKRSLAAGLVIAAAGLPTTAQAMIIQGPSGDPARSVTSGPSAPLPIVTTHSSFQWGDAGIGAAGAAVLLGAGVLGAGATRRRRTVAG